MPLEFSQGLFSAFQWYVGGSEPMRHIDGDALSGQVADVAHGRLDEVLASEVAVDGPGFCGGFDDHQLFRSRGALGGFLATCGGWGPGILPRRCSLGLALCCFPHDFRHFLARVGSGRRHTLVKCLAKRSIIIGLRGAACQGNPNDNESAKA